MRNFVVSPLPGSVWTVVLLILRFIYLQDILEFVVEGKQIFVVSSSCQSVSIIYNAGTVISFTVYYNPKTNAVTEIMSINSSQVYPLSTLSNYGDNLYYASNSFIVDSSGLEFFAPSISQSIISACPSGTCLYNFYLESVGASFVYALYSQDSTTSSSNVLLQPVQYQILEGVCNSISHVPSTSPVLTPTHQPIIQTFSPLKATITTSPSIKPLGTSSLPLSFNPTSKPSYPPSQPPKPSTVTSTRPIALITNIPSFQPVVLPTSNGNSPTCSRFSLSSTSKSTQLWVLCELYYSTNGPQWLNNNGWNFTGHYDPCKGKWFGVSCVDDNIYSITLCNNNLIGSIPSTIGHLTSLQTLALCNNKLTNIIPSEIKSLVLLETLWLYSNHLNNSIPSEIEYLRNLNELELGNNFLTGSIPSNIGQLSNLISLLLGSNKLSGKIPSTLIYVTKLEQLDLSNNMLTGELLVEFKSLPFLEVLFLYKNRLNGTLKSSITHATGLKYLYLYSNKLTGCIPNAISNLVNIEELFLQSNLLTGSIPNSMQHLTNLLNLNLSMNQLNGTFPDEFKSLVNLRYLDLNSNSLSGKIPDSIQQIKSLQLLFLYSNKLSSAIPRTLGDLSSLQYLDLHNNLLSNNVPVELGKLSKLITLDLSSNFLSGPVDKTFQNLSSCLVLRLQSNKLSGSIPIIPTVLALVLSNNRFRNTLPQSLSNMSNLQFFDASSNSIRGKIPSSIGGLSQINYLSLAENEMSGKLPAELYALSRLQTLNFQSNSLNGNIIENIKNLTQLAHLNLKNNGFSGQLPVSLGELTCMQTLLLGNNKFTGIIPTSYRKLANLEILDLSKNYFEGSIDSIFNITSQRNLSIVDISNNQFTGGLNEGLFQLSSIKTISAGINCFNEDVQSILCQATTLQNVYLDGMGSSLYCPGSQLIKNPHVMQFCLFNISSLATLHLSGYSIKGSFPADIKINRNLHTLDLSNNVFAGAIPSQLFDHPWQYLNLGYNKFTGVLPSSTNANFPTSLTLGVNRLSGLVPSWARTQNISSISILIGNAFACDTQDGMISLPKDPNAAVAECSSASTDISFYFFLGGMAISCTTLLFITYLEGPRLETVNLYYKSILYSAGLTGWKPENTSLLIVGPNSVNDSTDTKSQVESDSLSERTKDSGFLRILGALYLCWGLPEMCIFIVGLLVTGLLHEYYSTYSVMYAWQVSFCYLGGIIAVVVLIIYTAVLGTFISRRQQHLDYSGSFKLFCNFLISTVSIGCKVIFQCLSIKNLPKFLRPTCNVEICGNYMCVRISYAITFVISAVVALLSNIFYVYYSATLTGFKLHSLKFFLAVIKSLYRLFPIMHNYVVKKQLPELTNENSFPFITTLVSFIMNFFSVVISPAIATVVFDVNCFRSLVPHFSAPTVSSEYVKATLQTSTFTHRFSEYNPALPDGHTYTFTESYTSIISGTTEFQPPFIYSYQCASSLMSSYTSVFVYYALFNGFTVPMARILCRIFQFYIITMNSNSVCLSRLKWFLDFTLNADCCKSVKTPCKCFDNLSFRIFPHTFYPRSNSIERHQAIYDRGFASFSSTAVALKTMALVAFTFGVVYPPLGIVMIIAVMFNAYISSIEITFSSYRTFKEDPSKKDGEIVEFQKFMFECLDKVRKEFQGHTIPELLLVNLFISFFLFDMIGDSYGLLTAAWASFVVFWVPLTFVSYEFGIWIWEHINWFYILLLNLTKKSQKPVQPSAEQNEDISESDISGFYPAQDALTIQGRNSNVDPFEFGIKG